MIEVSVLPVNIINTEVNISFNRNLDPEPRVSGVGIGIVKEDNL